MFCRILPTIPLEAKKTHDCLSNTFNILHLKLFYTKVLCKGLQNSYKIYSESIPTKNLQNNSLLTSFTRNNRGTLLNILLNNRDFIQLRQHNFHRRGINLLLKAITNIWLQAVRIPRPTWRSIGRAFVIHSEGR